MQRSEFTQIMCWQHLGEKLGDIATDAPFVGQQSTLMTFDVSGMPATLPVLFFIELLRSGSSMPQLHLNGTAIDATITNVGVSGSWEVWMVRCDSTVKQGANTLQIFCPPGGGDFVISNIAIFWHMANSARSSGWKGWKSITADSWQAIAGAGSWDHTAPQDMDRLAVNGWWNAQGGHVSGAFHRWRVR